MSEERAEQLQAIRDELERDTAEQARGPALPEREEAISLHDVWLTFERPVLCGLDLTAYQGETLLVVGESGAGKSTILKLILRLLVPDRGEVRVFGREITHIPFRDALELRRGIGMVFQTAALFDSLTVFENVAYPLRENRQIPESEIERIVIERLEFVDLDPGQVVNQLPSELSVGMRKRVGIARAIATDPHIVLYDEPTAGLDPLTMGTINRLIRKLQAELGVTSLVVSHDIRAGFRVATRVNLLREGRIVFDGTPEDMVAANDPYINLFLS